MARPLVVLKEEWDTIGAYYGAQLGRGLRLLALAVLLTAGGFLCGAYWAWTVWGAGHSWGG